MSAGQRPEDEEGQTAAKWCNPLTQRSNDANDIEGSKKLLLMLIGLVIIQDFCWRQIIILGHNNKFQIAVQQDSYYDHVFSRK